MEEDKFKKYYRFIDIYADLNMSSKDYEDEDEDDICYQCFEVMCPIYFGVLMNYLGFIIKKICSENSREVSEKIIQELKNSSDENNDKYCYKDITIGKLFKGDYEFLKKHFIINPDYIKNENDFIYNLTIKDEPSITYPFSLRELYNVLLPRAIKIRLDDYYIRKYL